MTTELTALALAGVLQVIQMILHIIGYYLHTGFKAGSKAALSSRDEPIEFSGTAARVQRAYHNHFESLAIFTIAVIVITLSDQSTPLTQYCAWVYVAARTLYIPAYAFGLVPWRSIIWTVAIGAATLMLLSAVL